MACCVLAIGFFADESRRLLLDAGHLRFEGEVDGSLAEAVDVSFAMIFLLKTREPLVSVKL